ncbi:MAG: hypothetical protein ACKOWE_06055 [Micrococcales bacterium]
MSEELRKIAATAYNRAFELVIEGDESDALEGLELAAASLHIWRTLGPDKRVAIGLWMYSRALLKAGSQDLAIDAALESVRLAESEGIDWMLGSSLEALTRAHQGRPEFEAIRARASSAIDSIQDDKERELISGQFADLRNS